MLSYCPKCKENSVVRKLYSHKIDLDIIHRIEFCINCGCGYRLQLPDIQKTKDGYKIYEEE